MPPKKSKAVDENMSSGEEDSLGSSPSSPSEDGESDHQASKPNPARNLTPKSASARGGHDGGTPGTTGLQAVKHEMQSPSKLPPDWGSPSAASTRLCPRTPSNCPTSAMVPNEQERGRSRTRGSIAKLSKRGHSAAATQKKKKTERKEDMDPELQVVSLP